MNENAPHIPLAHQVFSDSDAVQRMEQLVDHLVQRRTVRQFAPTPVQPKSVGIACGFLISALFIACRGASGPGRSGARYSAKKYDANHQLEIS